MNNHIEKLGKISLAILENFVGKNLGEDFVNELKGDYHRYANLASALLKTEERFLSDFPDKDLSKALFEDLSQSDRPNFRNAIQSFYSHPTDPMFQATLQEILLREFNFLAPVRIKEATNYYVDILIEELALCDPKFRDNLSAIANIRATRILASIESQLSIKNITGSTPSPDGLSYLHQLPPPPKDFVGRDDELENLLAKIQGGGVTISGLQGMGGVGKTALALKLADSLIDKYPDAQIYLDLRGSDTQMSLTSAEAMAHVIRSFNPSSNIPYKRIELEEVYASGELGAKYLSCLSGNKVLLLWDNARDAKQVESLLTKDSLTIITSRQRFTLPGLDILDIEILNPVDSMELIRKIAPHITIEYAYEITSLCGYLPLAIRLAGAMLAVNRTLEVKEYIARLNDAQTRFDLIEASFQLSFDLLDSRSKSSFRQLGITRPYSVTKAKWVLGIDYPLTKNILDLLYRYNLLTYDSAQKNYEFHDLVFLFSGKLLRENPQEFRLSFLNLTKYYIFQKQKWLEVDFELNGIVNADFIDPHYRERGYELSGRNIIRWQLIAIRDAFTELVQLARAEQLLLDDDSRGSFASHIAVEIRDIDRKLGIHWIGSKY